MMHEISIINQTHDASYGTTQIYPQMTHATEPTLLSRCTCARAAGVHGPITRYVTTIQSSTATAIYHFYELDAQKLEANWLEKEERRREWVDYAEAVKRLSWKPELAQGLMLSSLAPKKR
jgi:diphosphoinositol-polyphosphate diphosphatase